MNEILRPLPSLFDESYEHVLRSVFFNLYAFILLTSTIVPGINFFCSYNPSSSSVTGSEEE